MVRVVNRSRSSLTMALSIVHCMKKGLTSENTSKTKASRTICPNERNSPVTRPIMTARLIDGLGLCFSNPLLGHSSNAMPVKDLVTLLKSSRLIPKAGSCNTTPCLSTSFNTTK
ncbi:hypothetical protein D3C78_1289920 [compost metagenome]